MSSHSGALSSPAVARKLLHGQSPGDATRPARTGLQDQVAGDLEQVSLALDEDRLEAPLEDVSVAAVTPVEVLGEIAVELPHPAREGRLGSSHQKVEVVSHEDPRVQLPAEELDGAAQNAQEFAPVVVVDEDLAPLVPAGGHVPQSAGVVETEGSAHADSIV